MKKCILLSLSFVLLAVFNTTAQTNIISTNPAALQIMKGNYDPSLYTATNIVADPLTIIQGIQNNVSTDSLHELLKVMETFKNRNTLSDTTSNTEGIGAARRWVYSKFEEYSARRDNRLVTSYLQFDDLVTRCNVNARMRNIFTVLPGSDTAEKDIIFIEGHIDSRCEDVCSDSCIALGMEDNASGTALVIELARVMSRYTFKRTIVFLVTVGEEQGLVGANAFAKYCQQENIKIRGVLNNDVVGGIICGETASPPGCMGAGSIDSLNLRLFSASGFNSAHKQLARFTKLEYKENLASIVNVPMTINIMTPVDRSGRGGDHMPFSNLQFPALRFCAANEHGNADVTNVNYADRQHTPDDILGIDTDNDNIIDSFFVNFNYLARMSVINGNTAAVMAAGPRTPDFTFSTTPGGVGFSVYITKEQQYKHYRVALRSTTNDWDTVYTFQGSDVGYISENNPQVYLVSVASVDSNGMESVFTDEYYISVGVNETKQQERKIELLQNHPNPFDGETIISVLATENMDNSNAYISITDINGKQIKKLPIKLNKGINEVTYDHGYNVVGTYVYTLVVNGQKVASKRMIFAN